MLSLLGMYSTYITKKIKKIFSSQWTSDPFQIGKNKKENFNFLGFFYSS